MATVFDLTPATLEHVAGRVAKSASAADAVPSPARRDEFHGLTCLACDVAFESREAMVAHYRLPWHRANLRRRLCKLRRLTLEEFERDDEGSAAAVAAEEDGGENGAEPDDDEEEELQQDCYTDWEHEAEDDASTDQVVPSAAGGKGSSSWWLEGGRPFVTFAAADGAWGLSMCTALITGNKRALVTDAVVEAGALALRGAGTQLQAVILLQSGRFAAGIFEGGCPPSPFSAACSPLLPPPS